MVWGASGGGGVDVLGAVSEDGGVAGSPACRLSPIRGRRFCRHLQKGSWGWSVVSGDGGVGDLLEFPPPLPPPPLMTDRSHRPSLDEL